jgi:hypothetical protein
MQQPHLFTTPTVLLLLLLVPLLSLLLSCTSWI